MQAKLDENRVFSERSDALSEHLRISLRETAARIGISQAMLFAYRTGKSPVSGKAWRKLEAAERAAGLRTPGDQASVIIEAAEKYAGKETDPEKAENLFNRLVIDLAGKIYQLDDRIQRLDELEQRLEKTLKRYDKSE